MPTSYLDLVVKRIKQPGVSAEDAAEYANDLLKENGFDYEFEACAIVKANAHPRDFQDKNGTSKIYNYSFVQTSGRQLKVQLIGDPTEALCGECSFEIPLLRVTKRELLVVSQGKQYFVKRPPGFLTKEISLVDRSMRRVLRTWEVPLDTELAGISADGTKLFLGLFVVDSEDSLSKLVLEVSRSSVRFRARSRMGAQSSEYVKRHPIDPRDAYLAFKRFHVGSKYYIIRYDEPCT